MKPTVKFKKLRPEAQAPAYQTPYAAGADLYAALEKKVRIYSRATKFIPTGIAAEIPEGYVGLIFARSSLACKSGVAPANKVGVIDSDYRGEIMVALHNHSLNDVTINPGDRIAQLVIVPYLTAEFVESEELSDTVRADGGFGSTGK